MPCLTKSRSPLRARAGRLPAARRRQGYPLKALLRVIGEQVDLVEQDIAALYDNWFIETCDDWVVPYIGSLIDYQAGARGRRAHAGAGRGASGGIAIASCSRGAKSRTPCALRRRKGTLAALQEVATATSGWPTRVVEICAAARDHAERELPASDARPHHRSARERTPSTRWRGLQRVQPPPPARSTSAAAAGRAADVRAYVWRLRSYAITKSPAYCYEEAGPNCFLFNPLGIDTPLFTRPRPRRGRRVPGLLDLPTPITRRNLERILPRDTAEARVRRAVLLRRGTGACRSGSGRRRSRFPRNRSWPADLDGLDVSAAARTGRGRSGAGPHRLSADRAMSAQSRACGCRITTAFSADMGGGEYAAHAHRSRPAPSSTASLRARCRARSRASPTRSTQWQADKPAERRDRADGQQRATSSRSASRSALISGSRCAPPTAAARCSACSTGRPPCPTACRSAATREAGSRSTAWS